MVEFKSEKQLQVFFWWLALKWIHQSLAGCYIEILGLGGKRKIFIAKFPDLPCKIIQENSNGPNDLFQHKIKVFEKGQNDIAPTKPKEVELQEMLCAK